MRRTLAEGYSLFLYPEGTRNRTNEPIQSFHRGAFMMAIETGRPVAVQTLVRVKHISRSANGLDYWPGKVKVVWSKPIEVKGMTIRDVRGLSEKVSEVMKDHLDPVLD